MLMVTGTTGLNGRHAASLAVNMELPQETENVTILLLNIMARTALDLSLKPKTAVHHLVVSASPYFVLKFQKTN